MASHRDLATMFDKGNRSRLGSPTMERLWRNAYGASYPADVRPNAFYSLEILQGIERAIGPAEGQTLVDLGCGHGGAGLWLAGRLGMRLVGIDVSPGSVALARERAAVAQPRHGATFRPGDLTDTGLDDASCAAAISLDVLLYLPDKLAALREIARLVRQGGRFAFTTWEQTGFSERLGAAQVSDYRPLLDASGFEVELYEEPPDWRRQQRDLLEASLVHKDDLCREMGAEAGTSFVTMASAALKELSSRRYVLGIARRR